MKLFLAIVVFLLWVGVNLVDNYRPRSWGFRMILGGVILGYASYIIMVNNGWWPFAIFVMAELMLGFAARTYRERRHASCWILTIVLSVALFVIGVLFNRIEGVVKWYWVVIPITLWLVGYILPRRRPTIPTPFDARVPVSDPTRWWVRLIAWAILVAMLTMIAVPSLKVLTDSFITKMGTGIGQHGQQISPGGDETKGDQGGDTTVETTWYHFYNNDIQGNLDGVEGNNKEFGPNPIRDGWTVNDYVKDQAYKYGFDPSLLSITEAVYDRELKSDTMGKFYDSVKGDWNFAIEENTLRLAADENLFIKQKNLFKKDIDDNYSVEHELLNEKQLREKYGIVVQDMAYMRPGNNYDDGIPRVIVCFSDLESEKGLFLIWKITVKKGELPHILVFRVNCGYQPVNVSEALDIKPIDPNDPWIDGGGTPPKTPEESYNKDKTKSTSVSTGAPNTAGASTGNFTGDGKNGNRSTEDTSETDDEKKVGSYEEYEEIHQDEQQDAGSTSGDKPEDQPAETPYHTEGAGGSDKPIELNIP